MLRCPVSAACLYSLKDLLIYIFPCTEHIAYTWKKNGGGGPMEKFRVYNVDESDVLNFLRTRWSEEKKQNPNSMAISIYRDDKIGWQKAMHPSVGKYLSEAMKRRPEVFHDYEIKYVQFNPLPGQSNWPRGKISGFQATFILGPKYRRNNSAPV